MGAFAIFAAEFIWAIGAIFLKKVTTTVNPFAVAMLVEFCAACVLIPLLFFTYKDISVITRQEVIWVLIRGAAVGIGGVFFIYGISRLPLTYASIMTMTYPLCATILAILFLGEPITWRFMMATILFVSGYLVLTLK